MSIIDKINVGLYGGKGIFGGKETPIRAEEIYCDKYESCSLYKNKSCLNVTSPLSGKCKFGNINRIQGYTSRAKKYYEFRDKYKNDEKYANLKHPSDCKIALIDDYVYLNVVFTRVDINEKGNYFVKFVNFSSGDSWIELDKFDCNLLYSICSFRPQAMMGGEITSYKDKEIPNMLLQLKDKLPELHREFIDKYPQFDVEPNYIGKKAYIKTMSKDSVLIDCCGNEFIFDDGELVCEHWKSSFAPFDAEDVLLKIKVTDDITYKINNNSQVTSETIFVQ